MFCSLKVCRCSSGVEQLICNQQAVGSNPSTGSCNPRTFCVHLFGANCHGGAPELESRGRL